MAKKQADNRSVYTFLSNFKKIGKQDFDVFDSGDAVELYFDGKLIASKQKIIVNDVYSKLTENFDGSYELGKFKYDEGETILKIKVSKAGVAGAVPTDVQEAGSAFVMTRVLTNNKKFTRSSDIISDAETKKGLDKIFGSTYKEKVVEWSHSYFEHQKAFFAKFQPSQWDVFEHGGEDLMSFVKTIAERVKTDTGQPVGRYETWNPADIWVVKNKTQVKRVIEEAIQKDGTAKLVELNNVLLNLMRDNKLIGLSLKRVKDNQAAKFKYVNMDTKRMEFASIEEVEFSDIKFEIDVKTNVDGMQQGAYALFGNYTINIIRTPTPNDGFSNLKFESVIKNSGGRGGAAPVELVQKLIKSKGINFVNRHQDYPKNASEFNNDRRNYKQMYNALKPKINFKDDRGYDSFRETILEMYRSGKDKSKSVAQSKLMQLEFFYQCLNTAKGRKAEFWTDLFYLSIKRNISVIGNRFAPHGKLDVKQ